jgi:hypothetical protein
MGHSDFLFARPSFIGGMASVVDLAATLNIFNASLSENMADSIALNQDWKAIIDDLRLTVQKMSLNEQKAF